MRGPARWSDGRAATPSSRRSSISPQCTVRIDNYSICAPRSIVQFGHPAGIASPNRRPTIFDVFRPRAKSEMQKKKDAKDAAKASGSDRDNSSGSGSVHGGSGGIMHTIKGAVQHTIGSHRSHAPAAPAGAAGAATAATAEKSKFRDGSAHPHAGSDAQVRSVIVYPTSCAAANVRFVFPALGSTITR